MAGGNELSLILLLTRVVGRWREAVYWVLWRVPESLGLHRDQGRHYVWKGREERGQGQQTAESGQQSKRHRQQDHDRLRQRGQCRQWRTSIDATTGLTVQHPTVSWLEKTYCRILFLLIHYYLFKTYTYISLYISFIFWTVSPIEGRVWMLE